MILELGGHTEKTFLAQDLIIPSPGVPADDPFLSRRVPRALPSGVKSNWPIAFWKAN